MARITKKGIYAEWDVEYVDGYLITPYGKRIRPLLKFGTNSKVGNAHTYSHAHGNETYNIIDVHKKIAAVMAAAGVESLQMSCPYHCEHCYCDAGFYNMPDVKAGNFERLILARYYMEWVERAICAQIVADHVEQVRIHAAGDFFNAAYSAMWRRIAQRFDGEHEYDAVIFWTYTKEGHALKSLQGLRNVFVVPSCTPAGFNFGTCAELLYKYDLLTRAGYRVHICSCGTPTQKALNLHCADCKHGCKAVGIECDYVLFIMHSTDDYTAGVTDPDDYAKVCAIVAAQTN